MMTETHVDHAKTLPVKSKERFDLSRLFTAGTIGTRIWFLTSMILLSIIILQPIVLVSMLKARERVVIVDGAGSYTISPVLELAEAAQLHENMGNLCALALFQRNPEGRDYQDLLDKIFLQPAADKALADLEESASDFHDRSIHQKVEVFSTEILRTSEDQILMEIKGQLIRTGIFNGRTFTEAPELTLNLIMVRNPNMLTNKRFPLGLWDFEFTLD